MINPADLKVLEAYRDEVLAAVCERHGVEPHEVCYRGPAALVGSHIKTAPICHARHDMCCILRTTVWQSTPWEEMHQRWVNKNSALIFKDGCFDFGAPDDGDWPPLSYPNIGRLVGCNHVTVMNAVKRREKEHGDWRLTLTDYLRAPEAERSIPSERRPT